MGANSFVSIVYFRGLYLFISFQPTSDLTTNYIYVKMGISTENFWLFHCCGVYLQRVKIY